MFGFLKKKKGEKHGVRIEQKTTDYYKVIRPDEIAELPAPPFNQSQYGSEADYVSYLRLVQPLIEEYERTGEIHTIEFKSLDDVAQYSEEKRFLDQFRYSFLDCGSHINTVKKLDGTYIVASNGRHRMYVARKYGLKLLVHVSDEEYVVWE